MATPRVASGVLILRGRSVLMVRPSYKDHWEIPGGYAEPGESPGAACRREIREEIGLDAHGLRFAAVDWAPDDSEGDKLLFLFADPALHGLDADALRFPDGELLAARYVELTDLENVTVARLARRVRETAESLLAGGSPLYLEHGSHP
ncbi:NUDIX domain-containing protein [Nocardia sp. alder85J]|uniref:NUDIX domain-containing protein n=1 Tax=Nocardia sp. alder85J TaxID=2862949 RepID=UPI001CD54B0D|nr:NUDIX domain-containing protein [Nocardia sp. alder85J]MCX4096810.1 NUDIX domain-containing protein [Nocardia sp. alder85J]